MKWSFSSHSATHAARCGDARAARCLHCSAAAGSTCAITAPLRSGTPAHALWHWRESDLWDGGFAPEGDWSKGWWAVAEPDILYSADLVLAAAIVQ